MDHIGNVLVENLPLVFFLVHTIIMHIETFL